MPLTDLVAQPAAAIDPAVWQRATEGIPRVLAGLAAASPSGRPLRLGAHDIRVALEPDGALSVGTAPFAWSARTAQRALGLAAVRTLVASQARTPSDAVREVVSAASRLDGGGSRPPTSLERWLGSLSPAGRAAAGAAAVTWATRLWGALDWDALAATGPPVIGRDHWWDSPHTSLLALRSRAEVRTSGAHLVVLNGPRRESARAELSLVTLVEALRSRGTAPPGAVVGWWPDAGQMLRVEPAPAVLDRAVAAVAAALRERRGRPVV